MANQHELGMAGPAEIVGGLLLRSLGLAAGVGIGILLAASFFPG